MVKNYIFCLESGKELVNWFTGLPCESKKESVFEKMYDFSSKEVCDKRNPIILVSSTIKSRLINHFIDSSFNELFADCFFQGVDDENVDGNLNATDSTLKLASLAEFMQADYIVVCKNKDFFDKLNEQGLNCVLLSDLEF